MTVGALVAALEDLSKTEKGSEEVKIQHGESTYGIQSVARLISGKSNDATILIRFIRERRRSKKGGNSK